MTRSRRMPRSQAKPPRSAGCTGSPAKTMTQKSCRSFSRPRQRQALRSARCRRRKGRPRSTHGRRPSNADRGDASQAGLSGRSTARRLGFPHLCRFILVAIYTGARRDTILSLRLSGPSAAGGWFDLDAGLLYRKGEGERSTNKRRTPARLPRQLRAHARRWQEARQTHGRSSGAAGASARSRPRGQRQ
jgi:hypothetical protein